MSVCPDLLPLLVYKVTLQQIPYPIQLLAVLRLFEYRQYLRYLTLLNLCRGTSTNGLIGLVYDSAGELEAFRVAPTAATP